MANITANTKKEITLRNEIKVDDTIVVGQTASINAETNKVTCSDWKNDMDLYEANRAAIRELMFAFEDEAFAEKEKLAEGGEE